MIRPFDAKVAENTKICKTTTTIVPEILPSAEVSPGHGFSLQGRQITQFPSVGIAAYLRRNLGVIKGNARRPPAVRNRDGVPGHYRGQFVLEKPAVLVEKRLIFFGQRKPENIPDIGSPRSIDDFEALLVIYVIRARDLIDDVFFSV